MLHVFPLNEEWQHDLDGTSCPCGCVIEWEHPEAIVIHRRFQPMLEANIEVEQEGSGVDENDNSMVRYTIKAKVTGPEPSEVISFERAWNEKYPPNSNGSAARFGQVVNITSRGWHFQGIGIDKMKRALVACGVESVNA